VTAVRARIRAVYLKEFREYRRNWSIISTMAVVPLGVVTFPLILVIALPASAAQGIGGDPLVILLGIPAIVPSIMAGYAIVGERVQGTLEPLLSTAISSEELVVAKALAVLVPSLAISYGMYAAFVVATEFFAQPAVAAAVLLWPYVVAQLVFTPLIAVLSIWIGFTISARVSDVRAAQQLSALSAMPVLLLAYFTSFDLIHMTLALALVIGAVLLALDAYGWRLVAAAFDRERLITGTR
jgi:ABC-type Na+ efflux pump permease subunit